MKKYSLSMPILRGSTGPTQERSGTPAESHYPTMGIEDIRLYPLENLHKDCAPLLGSPSHVCRRLFKSLTHGDFNIRPSLSCG